jgi:hypothetical protein
VPLPHVPPEELEDEELEPLDELELLEELDAPEPLELPPLELLLVDEAPLEELPPELDDDDPLFEEPDVEEHAATCRNASVERQTPPTTTTEDRRSGVEC